MRQGTVRCGSRRRDRYGEFVRGSTRGIGAANRSCESAQTTDAKEIAKRITPVECTGIGAEICAGYWCRELRGNLRQEIASGICVRNLRQEIGTEVCCGGLRRWNYAVGLKIGKARNRHKKRPRKNRGHTVELNFRAEVSAATHIGWTKQSSFFHRLQDPKFRLSRHRVRGTVVRQTPVSCFVLGPVRDLRIPLRPLFQSQATVLLSLVFLRVTTYLIRSPPGPGIIRQAAPARARRHRRPESRPAAWRRVPRTRSRAPAASRRPS